MLPDDGHDPLEHIWGWSQFGGLSVGLVALGLAGLSALYARKAGDAAEKSAASAERTAKAAEETAVIAREEVDMLKAQASRRAVLTPQSLDIHPSTPTLPVSTAHAVVVAIGLFNSGEADAGRGVINLVIPPSTVAFTCSNERGDNPRCLPDSSHEGGLGGASPSAFTVDRFDAIRGFATVAFYKLEFAQPGIKMIRIKIGHPLADPVGREETFTVS